jgi:hypothetical protein
VLIGRHLLVRPVRHLLRGALLDRTSDKYSFRVRRYFNALYDPAGGVGYGDYVQGGACQVWQPHFESVLIDSLAEDIFDHVGRMTTLDDFAADLSGTDRFHSARVTALVLSGDRDGATEYVREIEKHNPSNPYWERWAKTQWDFIARDIDAVCAEFHAKEAETVKALKLDDIWEPSPFPVEVPVAERTSSSTEPLFLTTPWINRPPWLLQDAPQRPGDVRFSKDLLRRKGHVILLVPLTPQEAEERHRELESYILAARLPHGLLLVIRRSTGWDRNEPRRLGYSIAPQASLHVELHGSSHVAAVSASPDRQDAGAVHLYSIDVYARDTRRAIWHCSIDLEAGERRIHDSRTGQTTYVKAALAAAERDLVTCPMPTFGEHAALETRLRSLLESAGYGVIA